VNSMMASHEQKPHQPTTGLLCDRLMGAGFATAVSRSHVIGLPQGQGYFALRLRSRPFAA
jgi:hypothetical protein